jgi:hypothetical protein
MKGLHYVSFFTEQEAILHLDGTKQSADTPDSKNKGLTELLPLNYQSTLYSKYDRIFNS